MPLFRVDFYLNHPVAATEIVGEHYRTLKEFETKDGHTAIKWYIVSAFDKEQAKEIAEKLVYQIWGDMIT